jgi:hypothetical protein
VEVVVVVLQAAADPEELDLVRLWQLNIARSLAAHDVAELIGVSCPVGEELARGMYEGTAPSADVWRSVGVYRAAKPVADDASWHDRYLALTGR